MIDLTQRGETEELVIELLEEVLSNGVNGKET